jgi:signal transduction histidine kinase
MKVGQKYFDISLGATSLISILFFTLFLFFPKEKINGFFALSTFFLSLFLISGSMESSMVSNTFWLNIFTLIAMYIGLLLMLFCIYRIFKRSLGFWFWTLCLLFFLGLVSSVVYPISYFSFVLLLYQFAIILLSIRALKTHGVAARIFISCMGLIFIYFISNVILQAFGVDTTTSDVYFSGLSFMLLPLSIAIYLGYSFSQRSKSLAFQLQEVKKLSSENTKILSEQKSTLEKEVTQRTKELNASLDHLKSTQSQLIQSEKMASLGELTAGIAHEIQNPLNFVNNFSEVSKELLDEMREELKNGDAEEVNAIMDDVIQNLEKITHHGKRADSIVKGMLQHSKTTGNKKEPTNINALADEYLRLAYHGLRAKDKAFNSDMHTDLDEGIKTIAIIPQDIGRVVLNLVTNAFYAVNEKSKGAKASGDKTYKPLVSIATKKKKNTVEIIVTDNGNGIPDQVRDKIFQPFFTTKPTGQGTGLGLSMSYDIITKGHGGKLIVETSEGQGTTFRIILPLNKTN